MLGIKCGVLLKGNKASTIEAVKLAMDANKHESKATTALEQALALLTSSPAPADAKGNEVAAPRDSQEGSAQGDAEAEPQDLEEATERD